MSLKEKMEAACEQASDPEEASLVLYNSMDKNEKACAWSKHQRALKDMSPEEQEKHAALAKKDKGVAAAAYILEKTGKQYMSALKKVKTQEVVKQQDTWKSELEMLAKWTKEELEAHIQSGRIHWRECPGTWGVYEYKDTQDVSRELSWKRQQEYQEGTEFEPAAEDLEKFKELFGLDWKSLPVDDTKGFGKGSGAVKGPGKGQGKGKGKGKGKNKGQEEKQLTAEEALEETLKACKKARNMVNSQKADLENALEKAKGQLSKSGKATAHTLLEELGKAFNLLKKCLGLNTPDLAKLKEILMDTAKTIKAAKDHQKELKQLANKTQSAAGSRKSGK
eukprot:Skav224595  [mRNA]  locus=scaffold2684:237171:238178:- [translate_table: standard]